MFRSPTPRWIDATIRRAPPAAARQAPRIDASAITMPTSSVVLPNPWATISPADDSPPGSRGASKATANAAVIKTTNGWSRSTSTPPITITSATTSRPRGDMDQSSLCHPGGVHAGMLDGSVRFVNDEINLSTWQAMASIDGREAVAQQ